MSGDERRFTAEIDRYAVAFYYNAHLAWFHRWLGGAPAPHDVKAYQREKGWPKEAKAAVGAASD